MLSFDAIDHQWLIKFLEYRIGDRRILRLIRKWLRAGGLDNLDVDGLAAEAGHEKSEDAIEACFRRFGYRYGGYRYGGYGYSCYRPYYSYRYCYPTYYSYRPVHYCTYPVVTYRSYWGCY